MSHLKYKVAIVVTTYNPNLEKLIENLNTYAHQGASIIVCDNSDDLSIATNIEKACEAFSNTKVFTFKKNFGIAYAQNIGCHHAFASGNDFVIEMDQDSKLNQTYVRDILEHYDYLKDEQFKIAAIGPLAVNKETQTPYHNYKFANMYHQVDKTLSSGLLVSKDAFLLTQGKNEALFIDYVDWEWCWRAKTYGLYTFIAPQLKMQHMLGDGHLKILGLSIGKPAPIRHYYQYRNALILFSMRHVPLKWKIQRFAIMIAKLPIYLFIMDHRLIRFNYIVKGVVDFVKNKQGKINA